MDQQKHSPLKKQISHHFSSDTDLLDEDLCHHQQTQSKINTAFIGYIDILLAALTDNIKTTH